MCTKIKYSKREAGGHAELFKRYEKIYITAAKKDITIAPIAMDGT